MTDEGILYRFEHNLNSPALEPSHYTEQTPILTLFSFGYCCIITGYCDPLAISNKTLLRLDTVVPYCKPTANFDRINNFCM